MASLDRLGDRPKTSDAGAASAERRAVALGISAYVWVWFSPSFFIHLGEHPLPAFDDDCANRTGKKGEKGKKETGFIVDSTQYAAVRD